MLNAFLFLLREFWLAGLRLVCLRHLPSWPKASPKNTPQTGFLVALMFYALLLCMARWGITYDVAKAVGMGLGFLVTTPALIVAGWPIFIGYLLISGFVDSLGIIAAFAGFAEQTKGVSTVIETLALFVLALRSFRQAKKER